MASALKWVVFAALAIVVVFFVFRNGLQLIGIASVYQSLITGILIIAAVALDQVSRRKG